MEKGKMGITLNTYCAVAFLLALCGQLLLSALLLAFVLIKEQDEFTSRQCFTAFLFNFLYLLLAIVAGVLSLLGLICTSISFKFGAVANVLFSVIVVLLGIGIIVLGIVAILNASKGKETNIPLLSPLAYKAFGLIQPKVQRQPPVQPQPAYNQGYGQQNAYGQMPMQQQPPMYAQQQPSPAQPTVAMHQPQPPVPPLAAPAPGATQQPPPLAGGIPPVTPGYAPTTQPPPSEFRPDDVNR